MIVSLIRRTLVALVLLLSLAALIVALVLTTRPQLLRTAYVDDVATGTIWDADAPIYASNPQGLLCKLTGCPQIKTSGPAGRPVRVICRDRTYLKIAGSRPLWIDAADVAAGSARTCSWTET